MKNKSNNPAPRRAATALLLASTFVFISPGSAQQNLVFDYNGINQAAVNGAFTTTSGSLTYFGTGGAGNSGYVDNSGGNITTLFNTPITTAGIQSFTISSLVNTGGIVSGGGVGTVFASFGFSDSVGATARFDTDSTAAEMFGLQIATASSGIATPGLSRWQMRTDTVSGVPAFTVVGSSFTLNSFTWYRVSATFTKTAAAGAWNFSGSVTSFGVNGSTEGAQLASASGAFFQAATYSDAELYGAVQFNGGVSGLNITKLDNFAITTVIPEPSAMAALAGLAALSFAGLRRRPRLSER